MKILIKIEKEKKIYNNFYRFIGISHRFYGMAPRDIL